MCIYILHTCITQTQRSHKLKFSGTKMGTYRLPVWVVTCSSFKHIVGHIIFEMTAFKMLHNPTTPLTPLRSLMQLLKIPYVNLAGAVIACWQSAVSQNDPSWNFRSKQN